MSWKKNLLHSSLIAEASLDIENGLALSFILRHKQEES
jgi:hypothetical protein